MHLLISTFIFTHPFAQTSTHLGLYSPLTVDHPMSDSTTNTNPTLTRNTHLQITSEQADDQNYRPSTPTTTTTFTSNTNGETHGEERLALPPQSLPPAYEAALEDEILEQSDDIAFWVSDPPAYRDAALPSLVLAPPAMIALLRGTGTMARTRRRQNMRL